MTNENTNQAMHKAIAHFPLTDAQSDPEQQPPPHPSSPPVLLSFMVRDVPVGSLGQPSWSCPLPAPGVLPASSLTGQQEELKYSQLFATA